MQGFTKNKNELLTHLKAIGSLFRFSSLRPAIFTKKTGSIPETLVV